MEINKNKCVYSSNLPGVHQKERGANGGKEEEEDVCTTETDQQGKAFALCYFAYFCFLFELYLHSLYFIFCVHNFGCNTEECSVSGSQISTRITVL